MKRIFSKIFLGYLAIIILLTTLILYFSFDIIYENYKSIIIKNQIYLSNSINYTVSPLIDQNDNVKLDSIVKLIGRDIKSRITIVDLNGIVLADSEANPLNMDNHSDRQEITKAMKSDFGTSIRHSYTVKKDMIYVAKSIVVNNQKRAIIRLSIFIDDFTNLIDILENQIYSIILIVLLISILLAFFLSKTMTKPILILANAFNGVANGDFSIRVNTKTNDELKSLGDNFNSMVEQLEGLFNTTNRQKDELDKIISSIKEGLVVISESGLISLSNSSFKKIVGYENIIGKHYWEVIRDSGAVKSIKKMIESDENNTVEIEIKKEFYICSANHINDNHELVLIFYNISEFKKLETIKKEFVVNVSHELRTPLTVIKGYIETIEEEIDEKNRKYVTIIKNHTNRLINIVQDLLSISQIEEKNIKLDLKQIDLKNLFENLNSTFEQKIQNKNLQIEFKIDDSITTFKADEFKLEQMFINLIDNAIRYTEHGSITISAINEASFIRFEVTDSGIGIPEKDKERIFERFYTVDKSRSRQLAGTGLGLAIVKHIVLLHKGKITIESVVGTGTKFVVLIPIKN